MSCAIGCFIITFFNFWTILLCVLWVLFEFLLKNRIIQVIEGKTAQTCHNVTFSLQNPHFWRGGLKGKRGEVSENFPSPPKKFSLPNKRRGTKYLPSPHTKHTHAYHLHSSYSTIECIAMDASRFQLTWLGPDSLVIGPFFCYIHLSEDDILDELKFIQVNDKCFFFLEFSISYFS